MVDAAVINTNTMKIKNLALLLFLFVFVISQAQEKKENTEYKKRVLETTEIDFLTSYYNQDGDNASVTGGIGTEELTDFANNIIISMPLNEDDILTIDVGISTYTSASSSNLDPFDASGASSGDDDDDDDDDDTIVSPESVTGSPWVASSGASKQDTWYSVSAAYSHSSDDRNTITSAHMSFAGEYDYISFGIGAGISKYFNKKNTLLGVTAQVYLDNWLPEYPTELDSYLEAGEDLKSGFFAGLPIYDQSENEISKDGNPNTNWTPNFSRIENTNRNTYSATISFTQIISKNAQFSIVLDLIQQEGWLANPMQRVYFKDKANYYVGNASTIPDYTSKTNTDVFQLADDIEQLPDIRIKTPIGARFNYFVNEAITLRSYYRLYTDSWGLEAHTAQLEIPIKIADKFTLYPSYRYYTQTAVDYFKPFNEHQSTQNYYTSDYDLSEFTATQYGFGVSYKDIFANAHIWQFGLKNIDFKFNYYERDSGLKAAIAALGFKFVMD